MSDRILNFSMEETFAIKALAGATIDCLEYFRGPDLTEQNIRKVMTAVCPMVDEKMRAAIFVHALQIAERKNATGVSGSVPGDPLAHATEIFSEFIGSVEGVGGRRVDARDLLLLSITKSLAVIAAAKPASVSFGAIQSVGRALPEASPGDADHIFRAWFPEIADAVTNVSQRLAFGGLGNPENLAVEVLKGALPLFRIKCAGAKYILEMRTEAAFLGK